MTKMIQTFFFCPLNPCIPCHTYFCSQPFCVFRGAGRCLLMVQAAESLSRSAWVWWCRALHIAQSSGIIAQADLPLSAPEPAELGDFFALIRPLFKQIKQNQHLRPTRFFPTGDLCASCSPSAPAAVVSIPTPQVLPLFPNLACQTINMKNKVNSWLLANLETNNKLSKQNFTIFLLASFFIQGKPVQLFACLPSPPIVIYFLMTRPHPPGSASTKDLIQATLQFHLPHTLVRNYGWIGLLRSREVP